MILIRAGSPSMRCQKDLSRTLQNSALRELKTSKEHKKPRSQCLPSKKSSRAWRPRIRSYKCSRARSCLKGRACITWVRWRFWIGRTWSRYLDNRSWQDPKRAILCSETSRRIWETIPSQNQSRWASRIWKRLCCWIGRGTLRQFSLKSISRQMTKSLKRPSNLSWMSLFLNSWEKVTLKKEVWFFQTWVCFQRDQIPKSRDCSWNSIQANLLSNKNTLKPRKCFTSTPNTCPTIVILQSQRQCSVQRNLRCLSPTKHDWGVSFENISRFEFKLK